MNSGPTHWLAQGWTPERAEELRLEAVAKKEAEQRLAPQPKLLLTSRSGTICIFPRKRMQKKAAQWFRSRGLSVEVRLGADNEDWLALVKHETIDNQRGLEKLREEMEALAERLNGEYDGWEVAV